MNNKNKYNLKIKEKVHAHEIQDEFKKIQSAIQLQLDIEYITVGIENIQDTLRQEIVNLQNLKILSINVENEIYGFKLIPIILNAIQNPSNLLELKLAYCQYSENDNEYLSQFAQALSKFWQLKKFTLLINTGLYVKCNGIIHICNQLKNFKNLLSLDLILYSILCIESEVTASIGDSLSDLNQIQELSLSLRSQNIQQEGIEQIIKSLINLSQLKRFSLNFLNSNENQYEPINIHSGLNSLINLEEIVMNIQEGNKSLKNLYSNIGSTFANLQQLQRCQLNIPIIPSQYIGLTNVHNLVELCLNFNQNLLHQEECLELCQEISGLVNLKSLVLLIEKGDIQLKGAIAISQTLQQLQNLKQFKLFIGHNNHIQDEGLMSISSVFKKLILLECLDMVIGVGNVIGTNQNFSLYDDIKSLINLTELRFVLQVLEQKKEKLKKLAQSIRLLKELRVAQIFLLNFNYSIAEKRSFQKNLKKCLRLVRYS